MLTLLHECHFWTTQNEIQIKNTDFGAYKYLDKKELGRKCTVAQGKRDYIERRDGKIVLDNRKPVRLRDTVRKLEELLNNYNISHLEWRDASVVQLLLSNGLIVYICLNIYTGDIVKMALDKYFVGKLASDVINDAIFTRQHILLSYNTNQITIVYLQKPNMRRAFPEKISNMDPKIFHILIPSASERRLARHLNVNNSFDLITVWTKSSLKEIYPWRPTIRDQDRANIHIYKLRTTKLETVAYCWTENNPMCVEFLKAGDGRVITVEQKVSRKGEITAEICLYEIGHMKMQRIGVTSIPMGTQICCHSFSPDQEKLFLGTIDRYICIYDFGLKTIKFAPKIDIIPTQCAWHPDSTVIIVANDRSQFQCFDLSLSFIANQSISEDVTPSNLHDISHYFTIQPTLLNISFSCKPNINSFSSSNNHIQTDCFLLLVYENGPIGCLRFFAGTGMTRDIQNSSGLTPDILISKYLAINQFEKAVNILLSLNWETCGATCLISLHKLSNYVFTRHDIKRSRNDLLSRALQGFPSEPNEALENEFGDQVIDLKRRYFFFLLRNKLYADAFDIAKTVDDYDLFMDLFNITKSDTKLYNFAQESFRQAETILKRGDNEVDNSVGESHSISTCSHLSCTECLPHFKSDNIRSQADCIDTVKVPKFSQSYLTIRRFQKSTDRHSVNINADTYVPPLPYLKSQIFNAENIKINSPIKQERNAIVKSNVFKPLTARSHSLIDFQYPRKSTEQIASSSTIRLANNRSNTTQREYKFTIKQDVNNKYQVVDLLSTSQYKRPKEKERAETWSHIPDQTIGIPINNQTKTLLLGPSFNISTSGASAFAPIQSSQKSNRRNEFESNTNNNLTSSKSSSSYYQQSLISGPISSSFPLQKEDSFYFANRPTNTNYVNYALDNNNFTVEDFGITPGMSKKDFGERNKVKFCDTVQIAVVPEVSRKDKPIPAKRNGFRPYLTDSQRELADSLPLCHPDDDYLKNFNPTTVTESNANLQETTDQNESRNERGGIKVVHFGVV